VLEPGTGLERRFQGELSCAGRGGAPRLIARMAPREYVAGIIAAELPGPGPRLELGAAVLRFLAQGPRYPDADVGDSTRSAYYLGRGPRPVFSGHRLQGTVPVQDPGLSDPDWAAICAASRAPGPSQWTSDDGGRPLSAREVWGGGEPGPAGPASAPSHPWTRTWSAAQLEQAFGAPVTGMAVGREQGVWVLQVRTGAGSHSYRYDQAHRLLARVLGWGALPSPADSVDPVPDGFRASGVGLGHRVGLSLGHI
jgi:YD repeat-containing protein